MRPLQPGVRWCGGVLDGKEQPPREGVIEIQMDVKLVQYLTE